MEARALTPPTIEAPRRSISVALAFVCVGMLVVVAPFVPHALQVVLVLANLGCIVMYLFLRRRQGPFDFLEIIVPVSVLHFLYFALGGLYLSLDPEGLRDIGTQGPWLLRYMTPAMALSLAGYLTFLAGYTLFFRRLAPSRTAGLVPKGMLVFLLPGVLGFLGFVASAAHNRRVWFEGSTISPLLSTVQQLVPLFTFGWFLVWEVFWHDRKSKLRNWVLLALFAPLAVGVLYLTLGSKEIGLTILALPLLAFGYARGKLPVKGIVTLGLVLVFLIFPIYNSYRLESRQLGAVDRLDRTVRTATRWNRETYLERSAFAFMRRMAVVASVAAVVRNTGRWVEFRKGDTLLLTPIALFIPRIVWPEKPNIQLGREFGIVFQFVSPWDRETNVAPTLVGELYWNFHVPGVLLGMFALGIGYRWCYVRYGQGAGFDPIRRAIYMSILPGLLHTEGTLAPIVSGTVKTLVISLVLLLFLRRIGAVGYAASGPPESAENPAISTV